MDETVSTKSVSRKLKRSPRWHGRVPASVLLDPSIDPLAARIYGILSLSVWQGNQSYIGMRLLAELCKTSPATVLRRLKVLESRGHIMAQKCGDGKRSFYLLNSEVFGQKQRDGVKEIVSSPRGGRRMVSVEVA
jgi:hypothetical protein